MTIDDLTISVPLCGTLLVFVVGAVVWLEARFRGLAKRVDTHINGGKR